jgi:hypothetical protein
MLAWSPLNRASSCLTMHLRLCASQHEELVATGRLSSLSPLDLRCRVLVKGKFKQMRRDSVMRRRFSKGRDTTNKMRRSKFVSLFRKTYHGSGRASESPGVSPYEDKADIFSLREDEIQDALASQLRASRVEFDEMVRSMP